MKINEIIPSPFATTASAGLTRTPVKEQSEGSIEHVTYELKRDKYYNFTFENVPGIFVDSKNGSVQTNRALLYANSGQYSPISVL